MGLKTKVLYSIALLAVVAAAYLWSSGRIGLWTDGMAHIANNTADYTDKKGYRLEGSHSMEVDLSDLDRNIGTVIYQDEDHRIYVSSFQRTNDGGYDIGFRSSGRYSLAGASLISAVRHETIGDHSFTTSTTATLTVDYNGRAIEAQPTGQCGLNYKDGDCFSFAFALNDPPEASAEPAGIAKLTIADLYYNSWSKK